MADNFQLEHPGDHFSDAMAGLKAVYSLLLSAAQPPSRPANLHLLDPEDLCILLRLILEQLEEAQAGFREHH